MRASLTALLVCTGGLLLAAPEGPSVKLVGDIEKIWDQAPHNAFTDLARFQDQWYCVCREGAGHAAGAGKIRVLVSRDGKKWEPAALLQKENVDLRDPHLSVTPDGRLMIVGGAAEPASRDPVRDHYSFVSFSKDGLQWTEPRRVLDSWQWLWRVTWHKGTAYGVAYGWNPEDKSRKYRTTLYKSPDGLKYERVTDFDNPQSTEATLRFDGDVMYCLQRRDGKPNTALLGRSTPPYSQWSWKDVGTYFGGPNFLRAPDGRWWAVGRLLQDGKAQTAVCQLDVQAGLLQPALILPSGGDTSYAGLVWQEDQLWVSYYSSHQKKTSIYLARVRPVSR